MRITPVAAIAFMLLPLCTACRQEPAAVSAASREAQDRMEADYSHALTEDLQDGSVPSVDLLKIHQDKGLGLSLQITGRRFRMGQDIPLELVYENLNATAPVASTECSGFTVRVEDLGRTLEHQSALKPCAGEPQPADTTSTLETDTPRFLHSSLLAARIEFTHPGRYLISAAWQSDRPHKGGLRPADQYATVQSNVIPIVVIR